MQSACIGSLMELAEKDNRIIYLTADSGEGGLDKLYRMNFPDRSFDFGIAEGNMVAAAAGLAAAGKIPFVYTAAPFLVYRAYEFIRNDVCLQNLNVKLIGVGSGLTVSSLGPTHHTTEDIALLRVLPNLLILSPSTPIQVTECMKKAYEHNGPVYIRLAMNKEKEFFTEETVDIEHLNVMRDGKVVSLITTGFLLSEVMDAADMLSQNEIDVEVIAVPMLKPFDLDGMKRLIGSRKLIVTIEEHNYYGGLGGIVAEIISDIGVKQRLLRIGLNDEFSTGYGKLKAIYEENHLDAGSIYRRVIGAIGNE